LAREEPDAQRRGDYAGLAKVFAERAGCLPAWEKALEDPEVWQSQVIRGWRDQGRREGQVEVQRQSLLKVLQARFPGEVTAELTQTIDQAADLDVLSRWFDSALAVPSLQAFRAAIQVPQAPTAPANGSAAP
jgi:hypothetical protein